MRIEQRRLEMKTEDLVQDLIGSRTDLARYVAAASRTDLPYLVVAAEAVRAWETREPEAWRKVRQWLADQRKVIVEV